MVTVQDWLAQYSWEFVTAQNLLLCQAKGALHKPTSDGHDATQTLWNSRYREQMTLSSAVDLCRQCHRMARFVFTTGTLLRQSYGT